MALDNYTDLQAAIGNWMNRGDLNAYIPDFITLAETEIKRLIRRTTLGATLLVSAEFTALPSDCAELRSVRLSTGLPELDVPFLICTVDQLAEYRARWSNTPGRPRYGAVYNGAIQVVPFPDQQYTMLVTYYQALQPLSSSNATNAVLTEYPDLYLYGSLLAAEPFMEHDERIAMWRAAFDRAIGQVNVVVDREEFGASFKQIRLPREF